MLEVQRALPILPLVADPRKTWNPPSDAKEPLMRRLAGEVGRRGQTMPVVPQDQPEATEGAQRRAVRSTTGADAAIFEQSAWWTDNANRAQKCYAVGVNAAAFT
jgi:hypothetical protein